MLVLVVMLVVVMMIVVVVVLVVVMLVVVMMIVVVLVLVMLVVVIMLVRREKEGDRMGMRFNIVCKLALIVILKFAFKTALIFDLKSEAQRK